MSYKDLSLFPPELQEPSVSETYFLLASGTLLQVHDRYKKQVKETSPNVLYEIFCVWNYPEHR